ncbi:hypothetical protein [Microbulbifer epialgicus]|uniref:Uncharacterized protein n=1 Tax=Microbulbifer epialgicus TaxID=393907 RepID=A0ABV4NVF3_9GAMM
MKTVNILYWEPWKLSETDRYSEIMEAKDKDYHLVSDIKKADKKTQELNKEFDQEFDIDNLRVLAHKVSIIADVKDQVDGTWVECQRAKILLKHIESRIICLVNKSLNNGKSLVKPKINPDSCVELVAS